jgi:hypothetical protein
MATPQPHTATGTPLRTRILRRLYDQLSHEENPWLSDDLRIAGQTIFLAAAGDVRF